MLDGPECTVAVRDRRYLPGGVRLDEPATAYVRADGGYVVRNDSTGDIVQISNLNAPDWRRPF